MHKKQLFNPHRSDRRLSTAAEAEIQRVLRALMIAETPDTNIQMAVDVNIPTISDLVFTRQFDDVISVAVYRNHIENRDITVDDPDMIDCSHSHSFTGTLTTLEEIDPGLAYDLGSLVTKMTGLRPDEDEIEAQTIEGLKFDALNCLGERTQFSLMLKPQDAIYDLYDSGDIDLADRLGIPIEPTEKEIKN